MYFFLRLESCYSSNIIDENESTKKIKRKKKKNKDLDESSESSPVNTATPDTSSIKERFN